MDEVQLNTLYVVTEGAYLHRDGQTLIVEINKNPVLRLPIHLIDSIACFGRVMVSPARHVRGDLKHYVPLLIK